MSPEIVNGLFALGGAALGAVLTGALSWYQITKTKEKRELTILSTRPSNLIAVDSSISEMVKITVSNHVVPTVYTFDLIVQNSGNQTVSDICIPVSTEVDGRLLGVDIESSNFAIETDSCEVALDGPTHFRVDLKYLNPGEELTWRVLASAVPKKVEPGFRQPGVYSRIRTNYEAAVPDVISRALLDALAANTLLDVSMKISSPQYRRWREKQREDT